MGLNNASNKSSLKLNGRCTSTSEACLVESNMSKMSDNVIRYTTLVEQRMVFIFWRNMDSF